MDTKKKIQTLEDKLNVFSGSEDDAVKLVLSIFTTISEIMARYIDDQMYENCIIIENFVIKLIKSINYKFRRYESLENYSSVYKLRRMANEIFNIGTEP